MVVARVKFYGVVRDIVSSPQVELEMSQQEPSLRQVLAHLAEKYGKKFTERVLDSGCGVKPYVKLFVNSEEIDSSKLDTKLQIKNGSAEVTVYILPATEGG